MGDCIMIKYYKKWLKYVDEKERISNFNESETSIQKASFCCALGFIAFEATEYSCGGYSSMRPLTLGTSPYRTQFRLQGWF
jgi:hypothetical protein